jgi:sodium/potassium/calcium exchanger 6
MTELHDLYPSYRGHVSRRRHRRRYSPQSAVYTVLLFSVLGLAVYYYRDSVPVQQLPEQSSLHSRQVATFASSDEEVRAPAMLSPSHLPFTLSLLHLPDVLSLWHLPYIPSLAPALSSFSRNCPIPFSRTCPISSHKHTLLTPVSQCRRVHQAADQCAYITRHCPDEDPGFYSYLSLYYCRLSHAKPIAFLILISWLGLLFSTIGIAASDFFCINLSTIATILGMSESMAGVTFLAFGNGSPDVFSTFAAFSTNSSSLAIGELFGAACFITAVVAGSMALVRPFKVAKKAFVRDVGFFTVAAAFSLSFLWDGRLHLWECIAMVLFYAFYVAFVVAWHWWMGVRKRRRERNAAARGHFIVPGSDEVDSEQDYHDLEDDETTTRPSFSRGPSVDDFSALECGGTPTIVEPYQDEDDDEARDRWLAELRSNMRLSRPGPGSRRNTINPIRPSLVGALEFQAVLKSLQKARHHQTIPMHARRYSDDPTFTSVQQQDQLSGPSDPATRPPFHTTEGSSPALERPALEVLTNKSGRTRAVSANDAANLRIDPRFLQKHTPMMMDIIEDEDNKLLTPSLRPASFRSMPSDSSRRPHAPEVVVSDFENQITIPWSASNLDHQHASDHQRNRSTGSIDVLVDATAPPSPRSRTSSPSHSPRTFGKDLYNLKIPASSQISPNASAPSSPFPKYFDLTSDGSSRPPSLHLPPASVSIASCPLINMDDAVEEKPLRWWPYAILPPPLVLLCRLLPTLEHWRNKNWWERLLAIIASPSMFLLIVTLPVVEADREEEEDFSGILDNADYRGSSVAFPPAESPGPDSLYSDHIATPGTGSAATMTHVERDYLSVPGEHEPLLSGAVNAALPSPHSADTKIQPQYWNRWLTIIQLFLAPLLIVIVIYTQYLDDDSNNMQMLVRPVLICLLVSFTLLIPFLLTTTPTHRPKQYTVILSMAGFVVSIAWISTIAAQVVAVLKALAVILNMSHAIMGLTIFAVGNSLGDLVADITVARLGYPIMALSACLGGPMLNILLGIGLSGSWILIRGAEHRHKKHPEKQIRYRTYDIQVGQTLIVSGVTLLITLIGLIVAVPMNKWIFSRRIGWTLIGVWCISTTLNVVLEVVGVGESG